MRQMVSGLLVLCVAGCTQKPLYTVELYADEAVIDVGDTIELRANATVNGLPNGTAYLTVFSEDVEGSDAVPDLGFDLLGMEPEEQATYAEPSPGDQGVSGEVEFQLSDTIDDLSVMWKVRCRTKGKWELYGTMDLIDKDGVPVEGPGEDNDVGVFLTCQ